MPDGYDDWARIVARPSPNSCTRAVLVADPIHEPVRHQAMFMVVSHDPADAASGRVSSAEPVPARGSHSTSATNPI